MLENVDELIGVLTSIKKDILDDIFMKEPIMMVCIKYVRYLASYISLSMFILASYPLLTFPRPRCILSPLIPTQELIRGSATGDAILLAMDKVGLTEEKHREVTAAPRIYCQARCLPSPMLATGLLTYRLQVHTLLLTFRAYSPPQCLEILARQRLEDAADAEKVRPYHHTIAIRASSTVYDL